MRRNRRRAAARERAGGTARERRRRRARTIASVVVPWWKRAGAGANEQIRRLIARRLNSREVLRGRRERGEGLSRRTLACRRYTDAAGAIPAPPSFLARSVVSRVYDWEGGKKEGGTASHRVRLQ